MNREQIASRLRRPTFSRGLCILWLNLCALAVKKFWDGSSTLAPPLCSLRSLRLKGIESVFIRVHSAVAKAMADRPWLKIPVAYPTANRADSMSGKSRLMWSTGFSLRLSMMSCAGLVYFFFFGFGGGNFLMASSKSFSTGDGSLSRWARYFSNSISAFFNAAS